ARPRPPVRSRGGPHRRRPPGRGEAVAAVVAGGAVGGAVYLLLQRALGAPELAWLRRGRR
ncbi:MAG TPA: hypothetical protein VM390_06410, partial [Acidimicrobiales bacterium]|nr:hypothetical protein [Acidimicrobiales bacterium]